MPKLEVGLVDVLFFFFYAGPGPAFRGESRAPQQLCIASSYPEREAVGGFIQFTYILYSNNHHLFGISIEAICEPGFLMASAFSSFFPSRFDIQEVGPSPQNDRQ